MANVKRESTKFCKPCNSKTDSEAECWGLCGICGRRNHQTKYCKFKDAQTNPQAKRADKAVVKENKNKKKSVIVNNEDSRRESEAESEEEASEEDSPKKQIPQHTARSVRINYGPLSYRDLNEQLSNIGVEEKQGFAGSYTAYRASFARDDDTSVVKSRAYSIMQGGRGTDTTVLWTRDAPSP